MKAYYIELPSFWGGFWNGNSDWYFFHHHFRFCSIGFNFARRRWKTSTLRVLLSFILLKDAFQKKMWQMSHWGGGPDVKMSHFYKLCLKSISSHSIPIPPYLAIFTNFSNSKNFYNCFDLSGGNFFCKSAPKVF